MKLVIKQVTVCLIKGYIFLYLEKIVYYVGFKKDKKTFLAIFSKIQIVNKSNLEKTKWSSHQGLKHG